MQGTKTVVLDVVGLSPAHFAHADKMPHIASLLKEGQLLSMVPVFPPLTLPVQASLTTGSYPESHGIVANGLYSPDTYQVSLWEQPASLVEGERIWDRLQRKNPPISTAALFLQNSLYSPCTAVITPRPIHTHDGGMVEWCYSKPVGLYEDICGKVGPFSLMSYWGPMASIASSAWIAAAAVEVMAKLSPDLLFVYLPHLDYSMQRLGPDDPLILEELQAVDREAGKVIDAAFELYGEDAVVIVLSEYAFSPVTGAIPLNLILRNEGLLAVRRVGGREYLDLEFSQVFALVDHQIAHLYLKPGVEKIVRGLLERLPGIGMILDGEGQRAHRVRHRRCGDLVAVAARDRWFSYYWWSDSGAAPDFAGHVDIHRKPGYDPLELFIDRTTMTIPQDTSLVKGSHGFPAVADRDRVPFIISRRDLAPVTEGPFTTADAGRFIEGLFG